MGAAAGKAVQDIAVENAETRLTIAEHVMLQWNRSPGADTGIWDAEATYTNRSVLAAVDEILCLAETQPFPIASATRGRLDDALSVAMSRMVEEFLRLRVWNASQKQLRAAIEKLSVSLAVNGVSLAFPSTGGSTSTASTAGDRYSSGGSPASVPDELAALSDGEFLDELELICPASVSVLHEIAHRVIRAEYTEELLQAFTDAPCDVLDRFLSILQVECSRRTAEVVIKRWTLATKLIGKALVVMRSQLRKQSPGAFDGFRDEYLLAITKNRILILLKFADGFTTITSHEKLVHILGMYEALSEAAPSLVLLFSGAYREIISRQTEEILTKLASAIKIMTGSLVSKIRDDCSQNAQTRSATTDSGVGVGVHPLARYAVTCIERLAPHRDTLDLILADGGGGGGATAASLADLVSRVTLSLERNLEERERPGAAAGSPGQHLFLANNVSFVLARVEASGAGSLQLGDEWAARRRSRIDRHVAGYVEAAWAPAVACLQEAACRRPGKAVARFNSAFERTCGCEARCEVPDPALRAALRKAVSEAVLPAYDAFLVRQRKNMYKNPRLENSVRYTSQKLAESISELFEGEAVEHRKV